MNPDPVDALESPQALLDAIGSWMDETRAREVWTFQSAARFADMFSPDSLPPDARTLPGMERCLRLGGEGTPLVREFAGAHFGARIGKGSWAGKKMIANALDVRERFPKLWARVDTGAVRIYLAEAVAERTRHLSMEAARFVDDEIADYTDGRVSWSRFQDILDGKIVAADPEAAARREAESAARQFAKASRSSEDGMKGFYIRAGIGVIAQIDATVTYLAAALKALGDGDSEDMRRVKACLIMANPAQAMELLVAFATHRARDTAGTTSTDSGDADPADEQLPIHEHDLHPSDNDADDPDDGAGPCPSCGGQSGNPEPFTKPTPFRPGHITPDPTARPFTWDWSKLLPRVTLYLHLAQDTVIRDRGGVVRWEGEGPVTVQYLSENLAPFHQFVVKPVIDLANQAPVDAYEIPDRHREAVHLRTPADIFPYSSNLARSKQIDHNVPYVPPDQGGSPGQSSMGNYGPMARFHHLVKTFSPWEVKQPFPGIYLWRDPFGQHYLVDHTGTRKLGKSRAEERGPSGCDTSVHVDLGRNPVEYDFTHAS